MIFLTFSFIFLLLGIAFFAWAARHAAEARFDRRSAQRLHADAVDHFNRAQKLYTPRKDFS